MLLRLRYDSWNPRSRYVIISMIPYVSRAEEQRNVLLLCAVLKALEVLDFILIIPGRNYGNKITWTYSHGFLRRDRTGVKNM
ncbi:hypothetical protein ANN_00512 [Periplaneta americana]|uniref:Uncharacterized protein n=1 Tax=Periplaneta americana TaxID=6978 RepID=A0ABQ8TTT5_PERAM|nr:hypothetical protein ANN_00512 [Periplaneta americana]